MELHQFRHSAFCEKVRLVLAAKRLDYTVVEVTPGLGQLELFRLSGQRQVPVMLDGSEVIADSTAIALYLERHHPEPLLLPEAPAERARVLLIEDWADTALAAGCRLALVQAAAVDPQLRSWRASAKRWQRWWAVLSASSCRRTSSSWLYWLPISPT